MDFLDHPSGNNKYERIDYINSSLSDYLGMEVAYLNPGYSPAFLEDPFKYNISLYLYMLEGITTEGKELLDVSCGRGGGVATYAKYHNLSRVVGSDLNSRYIEFCEKNYPNIDFYLMNAENLKFDENSFDIITNVDSSFQYTDYEAFYKGVARILKPGGIFSYADCFTDESRFLDHSRLFAQIDRYDITKNVVEACRLMNAELNKLDISENAKSYIKYANDDNIDTYKSGVKFIKFVCYSE